MQKFNWSAIIGCLLISIAIIIAGLGIVNAINKKPVGGDVPGSFEIYSHDETVYGDFLNEYEAAEYLKIGQEVLEEWIMAGKLDGAYTTIELIAYDEYDENGQIIKAGTGYIFSKAKLTEFMNNLINSGR